MAKPKVPEDVFVQYVENDGPAEAARILNLTERAVHARRRRIEERTGRRISTPHRLQPKETGGSARLSLNVKDGIVIVGSDAHYWPGIVSTAHAGLVRFCEDMKPKAVVMNGDLVDGATLSRHPPIGWEYRPSFSDELEAVQKRLGEIEKAVPRARRIWPLGNHDSRYESRIALMMPELARVSGVHLKDHFPRWEPCWSVWINDSVVVKHRFKGGLHAAFNNTLWSGKNILTGHLHKGIVYPFSDYNGIRYGVDLPWMGEAHGPQVEDYTEDSPVNWRSGFTVLTFIDGQMCQPEMAFSIDVGVIEFRGQRMKV